MNSRMNSLWRARQPLVLASRSAARQAMLRAAGIPFDAVDSQIDERAVERAGESADPARVAAHLATAKAKVVSKRHPGRLVVGADQTLALGATRLSKPANLDKAKAQLRHLSGQNHELHSAFALVMDGDVRASGVETARLAMRPLSDTFIDAYLDAAGADVLGSVGVYQIEGLGPHLFERITGDHFTIMGLPLLRLIEALREAGAIAS